MRTSLGGVQAVSAAETRVANFVYKSTSDAQNGLLDYVEDATSRRVYFEYDAAGRIPKGTLPDTR